MEQKTKILLVEDDPSLGQILQEYLTIKGYETTWCEDGAEAWATFQKEQFHLCLLDVMLPKKDGFTLSKDIKNSSKDVPFIFLTAKSMKEDTLEGLSLGADDYMTKPFSMEELLLRIKAILRRTYADAPQQETAKVFEFGDCVLDVHLQELAVKGHKIHLTAKEVGLLRLLVMKKNQTMERSDALKEIWQDDSYFNARSMDVYIAKLRKYLKPDPSVLIQTIHGQGFRLAEIDQAAS
ncbi:response regulator transcription factor [Persicobacter psychrovividus]|uniref:DNA-binding response regulator n=1 Tax=Persicobacter psychrovividus TaxID=387638 RepID=A0ABM7VA33_9BACT|nr:DNA-binding response regulator [Persicobacter psychrovividus]